MKMLSNEEIMGLSREERYVYYAQERIFKWMQLTDEQKSQSIIDDSNFYIGRRDVGSKNIEEQIEDKLLNNLQKNEEFTYFWETKHPFSQWFKIHFEAPTWLIKGAGFDNELYNLKRSFILSDIFPLEKQIYSSTEQFMMYHKAIIFQDIESAIKIMDTNDVRKIKELGRNIKGFEEYLWKFYRSEIVYEGNKAKFIQNQELKEILLATDGTSIVEASPDDTIWGIGLHKDDNDAKQRSRWKGKNLLGEILTKLRNDIINNKLKTNLK